MQKLTAKRIYMVAAFCLLVFFGYFLLYKKYILVDKSFLMTTIVAEFYKQRDLKPKYISNQIIVKYKESFVGAADEVFRNKKLPPSGAAADHEFSDNLERIHTKNNLRSARPLFNFLPTKTSTGSAADVLRARKERMQLTFRSITKARNLPTAIEAPDLTNIYVLEFSNKIDAEKLAKEYATDPSVEYAHPNYIVKANFLPNDPYYSSSGSWGQKEDDLWGLKAIKASDAWDITQGDGAVVAVVDTGIDYNHPDIAENMWVNSGEIPNNNQDDDGNSYADDYLGWSFIDCKRYGPDELAPYQFKCVEFYDSSNNPVDDNGHGTHVAGIVAAAGNNNLGIIGVAPKARVMAVKGMNEQGMGGISSLAPALVYAALNGADVINNSWSCSGCVLSLALEDAVRTAYSIGSVVVFAAGNSSADVIYESPANMTDPKPIVVAACTQFNKPTFFSSYGKLVDVCAPGGGILSGLMYKAESWDGVLNILSLKSSSCAICDESKNDGFNLEVGDGYLRLAGTSMAAPYVSGLAALVKASHPNFSNEEIRLAIRLGARDIMRKGFDDKVGAGLIQAQKAVSISDASLRSSVSISYPQPVKHLDQDSGVVEILGNAASSKMSGYSVYFKPITAIEDNKNTTWTKISHSRKTIENGLLASWDIYKFPDAYYAIMLVVKDRDFGDLVSRSLVHLYRGVKIESRTAFDYGYGFDGPWISWIEYVWDLIDGRYKTYHTEIGVYNIDDEELKILDTFPASSSRFHRKISVSKDLLMSIQIVKEKDRLCNYVDIYNLSTREKNDLIVDGEKCLSYNNYPELKNGRIGLIRLEKGDDKYANHFYYCDLNINRALSLAECNLKGAIEEPVASGVLSNDGNRAVILVDKGGGHFSFYTHDFSTGETNEVIKFYRNTGSLQWMEVEADSNLILLYEGYFSGGVDTRTFLTLFDIDTKKETRIGKNSSFPALSNGYVSWVQSRPTRLFGTLFGTDDLVFYNANTGSKNVIASVLRSMYSPTISDRGAVWSNWRGDVFFRQHDPMKY